MPQIGGMPARLLWGEKFVQIGIAFSVVGLILLFAAPFFIAKEQRFAASGALVEARVTSKTVKDGGGSGSDSSPSYIVNYTFKAPEGEEEYGGAASIGIGQFNQLSEGGSISIQYLPSNPTENRPASAVANAWMSYSAPVLGLSLLIGGVVIGYLGYRSAWATNHLQIHGVAHIATITEVERTNVTSDTERQFRLVYHYEGPDAAELTGKSKMRPKPAFDHLKAGETISILVSPEHPQISMWKSDIRP